MRDDITEMGICVQQDRVIINLGTCTGWAGMSKADALRFAAIVKAHAETIPEEINNEQNT